MNTAKNKFLKSFYVLLLCFSMFVGSTFAWFSDSIRVSNNVIVSGNLDVDMYWTDKIEGENTVWTHVETSDEGIFTSDNWEPGYTEIKYLKVVNKGNLAFKYKLNLLSMGEVGVLADVIDVYSAQLEKDSTVSPYEDRVKVAAMHKSDKVLSEMIVNNTTFNEGIILPKKANDASYYCGEAIIAIALHMKESAGNTYQNETIGDGFSIQAIATQFNYESDSFGNDYDTESIFPDKSIPVNVSKDISNIVNVDVLTKEVKINGPYGIRVTIPAGVKVSDPTLLTLQVSEKKSSNANIQLNENEATISYDVHVDGIAEDNTVPMVVELGKVLPEGLNKGNLRLYHVENGVSNVMNEVESVDNFTSHNQFTYEPATGDLALYMATFSEVAMVADTENAWNGEFDYSWYISPVAEVDNSNNYQIANADQLAAFGAIVGGMNGQIQNSFSGKTVKLISDVNLGDAEASNDTDKIFYPIGYYNSTGSYEKTSGGSVTSSVSSFEGTFDGNGHTISNFYQNTWEMFGDYNEGYSGTPNYYKDAMGLFGYVNGGTVKNLTVDNFSSDGEFTPTGVIAAYAVNSTFENIAITNCNPRVYNTGNGGIVGIGGNSDDPNTYKLTFSNITIDNTNKITALWGSWDVACGGLVGMFRGAGHVYMTNCHVAAQMDVYNDVCGNYQYYWYRYSGMMVGTNKNMVTDADGYTIPETDKFHATNCTVHFGEWNDYYYCELVANSLASYTHDHQFSRLTEIASLDEIKSGNTWTKTGNFLLISGDTKTCYHIVKNADGTLKQHLHTDAGEETVNGETVLKENNQIIYLPFNQLFTGYGWGVKHIPVYNGKDYAFKGITILDREEADSVEKFKKADTAKDKYASDTVVNIGELFTELDGTDVDINGSTVIVSVTPIGENSTANGVYVLNSENWKDSTIKFTGIGNAKVSITDYYYCKPTTIEVEIVSTDKFEAAFDHDENTDGKQNYINNIDKEYIYRIGNKNEVKLSSLFSQIDGTSDINEKEISLVIKETNSNEEFEEYEFTSNDEKWSDGTIDFNDSYTGLVTVVIKDDTSKECLLNLEVVDAVNATSATSAKSNNVVLLNNMTFSTIEVANGYTLYGNGFKMTAPNDVMYDAMGVGFVTLKNGTLDNVQIICPNFSYSILYTSQIKSSENTAKPSDTSSDARGNVRSAVMADGNSRIINSYVHGGRAAIFLRSGNLLVDNSTISGGAAANIHAISARSITLRNATLIQKPFKANVHDTSKTLMGFSGLFECDETGNSTPLILEGTLIQNAWINESFTQYAPSAASSIIQNALSKTEYLHDLDGDGAKESLNLGFTYIPQSTGGSTSVENITDNRTNKASIPYDSVDVENAFASAKVYSYKNTEGTSEDFGEGGDYIPNAQGVTAPTLQFEDTNADRVFETSFDTSDNRWESTLTVNLDNGDYTFSFDKLLAKKYGKVLTYTVNVTDGTSIDTTKEISLTSGVTTYVLTVIEGDVTHECYFNLVATKTSIPEPEVVDSTGGTPLLVVKSKNSDWSCAIPALEGIKIKYYTSANDAVTLDLATLTPTGTGKQNGTNNYWETTKDGYTLKVTCGYIHDTKQIYGMPVVVNNGGNKMYFTISSTNGYVSTGTSSRTVTLTYEFTDPNGKTLTFNKKWQFNYADYKSGTQYSYSDFVIGTLKEASSSDSCVTPDTLITLADGSQKRVDSLTGTEELLVWNLETGKYDKAPIVFIDSEEESEYEIIHLYFSDGSDVKVISEHGFFDLDLGKYVYIDANNYKDYVDHRFVSQDDINKNTWNVVTLDDVVLEKEITTAWSPVTYSHLCYYTNGVLSMPGGIDGLFNIYDVNVNTMKYKPFKKFIDQVKYGTFSYKNFEDLIPEEAYYAFNGKDLKVAMGKGLITWEDIEKLVKRYIPLMK